MASTLNNTAWVEWMTNLMGGVSRHTLTATFPPDRFYCLLDELPLHLLPRHAQGSTQANDDQPLYLNPECIFCSEGQIPDELAGRMDLLEGFAMQGTTAWVRDSAGRLQPFWIGREFETLLRELRPNEPGGFSLKPSARRILSAAGILISQEEQFQRDLRHHEMIVRASKMFRERDYAPLPGLIHPFHVAALRRYYRHRIRSGTIQLGDRQSPLRYNAHNEPIARFFHHQIVGVLSAVAGEPLKPSYVYMASYLAGAELKKHTDREQCEFSITLCLDFSPEPKLATSWPISMDTLAGKVTVYQALGDGLAYRGTRLPHYRAPLGAGQSSTSIFFHYVSEDFTGLLE